MNNHDIKINDLINLMNQNVIFHQSNNYKNWINISHRIGGLLPRTLMVVKIQHIGEIDSLVRCMENERRNNNTQQGVIDFSLQFQHTISEVWICEIYEVFRTIKSRKLHESERFEAIFHDLELLRVPFAKHEITKDRRLIHDLPIESGGKTVDYYSKNDLLKSYMMPSGISDRGSIMWEVIDIRLGASIWIERLRISEMIIDFVMNCEEFNIHGN